MLCLMIKNPPKQKMLDKTMPKKRNKKKKQRNQKDIITAQTKIVAIYFLPKIVISHIRLTKNSTAFAQYIPNFHILLKDAIYSWTKRKN